MEFRFALRELLDNYQTHSSDQSPTPDVRLIASTTRDLKADIESGRPDPLFHLLSRNRIAVPALTDRRQDIPVLIDHFVRRQARHLGKVVGGVSADSMRRLEAYAWPGNIRELRTVLERAILVSRSPVLEIDEELLDSALQLATSLPRLKFSGLHIYAGTQCLNNSSIA